MALFGEYNANLNYIEKQLNVSISDRGNVITLNGNDAPVAESILRALLSKLEDGKGHISIANIDAELRFLNEKDNKMDKDTTPRKAIKVKKKSIEARSPRQAAYIDALDKKDMVFGVGPAGTGKTYLAVAKAVALYEAKMVERMVFCRPAVEAGEKLGFLPGDMQDKIDPYLSPIYDALYDFLGKEETEKLLESGQIEIAPLAFMRGRTLSDACVILDEAQNTTSAQMKMFLSRMGDRAKMIITGDPDQTDLPIGQVSGLSEAISILKNMDDVSFTEFTIDDVVRHRLVAKILRAYDKHKKISR
ncbi:MAG: PhoH family protein [Alphaproteobacteria bacterium]|nr:PhoH family protein [Alphaproteobacteria bacterium]